MASGMAGSRVSNDTTRKPLEKISQGLPWWSSGEESTCNAGDTGWTPDPARSHMLNEGQL